MRGDNADSFFEAAFTFIDICHRRQDAPRRRLRPPNKNLFETFPTLSLTLLVPSCSWRLSRFAKRAPLHCARHINNSRHHRIARGKILLRGVCENQRMLPSGGAFANRRRRCHHNGFLLSTLGWRVRRLPRGADPLV